MVTIYCTMNCNNYKDKKDYTTVIIIITIIIITLATNEKPVFVETRIVLHVPT